MKFLLICALISFFSSLLLGKLFIPLCKTLNFAQPIKAEVLALHQKKKGTPTLGGFIFIFTTILVFSFTVNKLDSEAMFLIITLTLFSLIGFLDDFLKLSRRNNSGLSSRKKMVLILSVAIFLTYYAMTFLNIDTFVTIPFIKYNFHLGLLYIPFSIIFYTGFTNSVNLTDGLDGLSTSITIIVVIFLALAGLYLGNYKLSLFCIILAAALIGFLRYNTKPANIIMGDTGSIALGGIIASLSILLKLELVAIIAGGVYFLESGSSFLQIYYFKLTGKRIFKMAPIHHSFEISGVKETKIVTLFSITTAILCIIAALSMIW